MKNTPRKFQLPLLLALALAALSANAADVRGRIQTGPNAFADGVVRWKPTEKRYEVTTGNTSASFDPSRIIQLIIPRPPQIDAALNDLRGNRNQAVITALTPLLNDYIMLVHDEEIAGVLASAHLAVNNTAEAVKVCERVTAAKPEAAYKGKMVSAYWNALLASGNRGSKLEEYLEKAIKTGDATATAQALVLRGDLILRVASPTAADYKNALVDGYLRVVVLYAKEARDVLPEALYKAIQCFDKLGQTSRSRVLKDRLASEFPDSEWSAK